MDRTFLLLGAVAAFLGVTLGALTVPGRFLDVGSGLGEKVFLSVPPGAPQPQFQDAAKKVADASVAELRERAAAIQAKTPAADAKAPAAGAGPGGFNPADMAKLRTMTEDERKKWWQEQLDKMTPEQRKQWEERMKQGPPGGGGPGGGGGTKGEAPGGKS